MNGSMWTPSGPAAALHVGLRIMTFRSMTAFAISCIVCIDSLCIIFCCLHTLKDFFYLIMTCVNNTTDWLIDWLNWLILLCAGLPGEHVLASAMAGPASGVLGAAQQDRHRETRERHVEHHLDPGHVPTQWESCQVPSDHCRESHVEAGRPRTVVVRHQVSNDLHR